MLGKLAVLVVLCQVVVFTYGGVLPSQSTEQEESCLQMYINCTSDEDCCDNMRCLDFGTGEKCQYGTDNPGLIGAGQAQVQPPVDLLGNLGCAFYAEACENDDECCEPFICSYEHGECRDPPSGGWGLGFPGFNPGK